MTNHRTFALSSAGAWRGLIRTLLPPLTVEIADRIHLETLLSEEEKKADGWRQEAQSSSFRGPVSEPGAFHHQGAS